MLSSFVSMLPCSIILCAEEGETAFIDQRAVGKNQFLNFLYTRVRLPGDLIFGFLASLGSYGHREMREIL